jgi:hypothetical protein
MASSFRWEDQNVMRRTFHEKWGMGSTSNKNPGMPPIDSFADDSRHTSVHDGYGDSKESPNTNS